MRRSSFWRGWKSGAVGRAVTPCQLVLALALFSWQALAEADFSIQASVDRSSLQSGEQFTLSVELSGADAEKAGELSPPSLDEFARYSGSGTSTSIQIVNGRMSSRKTVNFYYTASKEGRFEIPEIVVELGGVRYRTDPIRLEIVAAQGGTAPRRRSPAPIRQSRQEELTSDDLFLRVEVDKTRVYPNEPVLLSYRIYTRVEVSRYGLANAPDRSGFWVEDLLEKGDQVKTSYEVINGQRYAVATIEKMALFPTVPGQKSLAPLEVECDVRLALSRRSIFDDFLSDPFGRTVRYTISSDPVEIEVLPFPEKGKPPDFKGAVGRFALKAGVDRSEVPTNDVVTLTVELEGSGNLRTVPGPEVEFPPGLEAYEPEVTDEVRTSGSQVISRRRSVYVLVPRAAGTHRIPPVRLAYFDPEDGEYRAAVTEEIVIQAQAEAAPLPPGSVVGSRQDVRLLAQDIRFIKLNPGRFRPVQFSRLRSLGFWLLALLPLCGLGVALLVRRHQDRMAGDVAYARSQRAGKAAKARLSRAQALMSEGSPKEFYGECGRALRGFVADRFNLAEAGVMAEELRLILQREAISEEVSREYLECLRLVDLKHFAPVDLRPEEMAEFLNRAERAVAGLHKELSR